MGVFPVLSRLLQKLSLVTKRPPRPWFQRKPWDLRLEMLETRVVPTAYTVTNTNDSGAGSLRQAILDANAAAGTNSISFSLPANSTITLSSAYLSITDPGLTITGPGSSQLTLSGGNINRIFVINGGAIATITGLTLQNGNGTGGDGGAIYNSGGTLTLDQDVLTNNTISGNGGAVFSTGTLTVTNSTFTNNAAPTGYGGAIYQPSGSLTIQNSTFTGNSAQFSFGAVGAGGTTTVTGSTFNSNSAGNSEGGLGNSGTMYVYNSTIANNTTTNWNGGGFGNLNPGTATLVNVTISGNADNTAGNSGGAERSGGGVYNSGTLTIQNSIIAGNSNNGGLPAPDLATDTAGNPSATTSVSYTLIGNTTGSGVAGGTGNLLNQTAVLGPLANNGGPTQTMKLNAGSPAVGAGSTTLAANAGLTTDQRGAGFARTVNGNTDMGAYQTQAKTWVGGSGDWNTAANWSGGTLPIASDNVVIPTGITVTHTAGNHSVNSLTIDAGGTLSITGGTSITTLTTSTTQVTVNGSLVLGDSGTTGSLLVNAANGTIAGTGSIDPSYKIGNTVAQAAAGQALTFGAGLLIRGNSATLGRADATLNNAGTIAPNSNNPSLADNTVTVNLGSGTNSGTINSYFGSTVNVYGAWTNTGSLVVGSTAGVGPGTLNLGHNSDAWTSAGGTITVATPASAPSAVLNLGGSIGASSLGTFSRDAASAVNLTGTWTGNLALTSTTGSWNIVGGTLRNGTLTTASGTALIASGLGILNNATVNGEIDVTTANGELRIQHNLVLNGQILGKSSGGLVKFDTADSTENQSVTTSSSGSILGTASGFLTIAQAAFGTRTVTLGSNITWGGNGFQLQSGRYDNQGTCVNTQTSGTLSFQHSGIRSLEFT